MIRRVVFLLEQPFDERNHERFGVAILEANGFEVLVFDCTPFRFPRRTPGPAVSDSRVTTFSSEEAALEAIGSVGGDTFVMNFIGFAPDTFTLFEALSAQGIPYAVNALNALPESASGRDSLSLRRRVARLLAAGPAQIPAKLVHGVRNALYRRRSAGLAGATWILAGGLASPRQAFYPTNGRTRTVWAHSLDYDLYLAERERWAVEPGLAVFLDQFLPYHPDFECEGRGGRLDPETYYASLTTGFDAFERATGLRVTIAAHPRSAAQQDYARHFGDRDVVYRRTAELTSRAAVVLAHYTTAVNLAVLFRKPVTIMTTNEVHAQFGAYIDMMASWLGRRVVSLSGDLSLIDWETELTIDAAAYDCYLREYITTDEAADIPTWQIVANKLKTFAPPREK